jgi:hypothetical protein
MNTITNMRHERDSGKVVGHLKVIADAAHDVVGHASTLEMTECPRGTLRVPGGVITEDGVWGEFGVELNRTAFRQHAERLSIPVKYLDQLCSEGQGDLAVRNFNERAGHVGKPTLFRLLKLPDEGWRLRAVLSDGFQAIDNLDVIVAVARGMQEADIGLQGCHVEADWSDDRFRLRIAVPQIELAIPDLLGDYRSPFSMDPNDPMHAPHNGINVPPVVWAGLEVSNSETGNGAASIVPRGTVLICRNGLTRNVDAVRAIHVGSRLEEGAIAWSATTQRKAVELLQSKIADATRTFCSVEYLQRLVDELRASKGVEVNNVTQAFEKVKSDIGLTESEVELALTAFMRSGDTSVFGLGQAITAIAQQAEDSDRQNELENSLWTLAARPSAYAG